MGLICVDLERFVDYSRVMLFLFTCFMLLDLNTDKTR